MGTGSDNESFQVIQDFLTQFDPSMSAVQEGLGLSRKKLEVFWALLSAVPEDSLEVPNPSKVAGKVVNTPSVYISNLGQAGVMDHGSKRGEWIVSMKAIKKMSILIVRKRSGLLESQPTEAKPGKKGKKGRRRTASKHVRKARKGHGKGTAKTKSKVKTQKSPIDGMTFRQIEARLEEIDSNVGTLLAEKEEIKKKAVALVKSL